MDHVWKNKDMVECPICGCSFTKSVITAHADQCLDETDIDDDDEITSDINLSSNSKRPRVEQEADITCDLTPPCVKTEETSVGIVPLTEYTTLNKTSTHNTQSAEICLSENRSLALNLQSAGASASETLKRNTKSTSLRDFFPGFQNVQPKENKPGSGFVKLAADHRSTSQSDVQPVNTQSKPAGNAPHSVASNVSTVEESQPTVVSVSDSFTEKQSTAAESSALFTCVPLAERMRPTTLEHFVGQGHVVGSQRPLRSLLESTSVSSMIFWGPPGCGKVTVSDLMCLS